MELPLRHPRGILDGSGRRWAKAIPRRRFCSGSRVGCHACLYRNPGRRIFAKD